MSKPPAAWTGPCALAQGRFQCDGSLAIGDQGEGDATSIVGRARMNGVQALSSPGAKSQRDVIAADQEGAGDGARFAREAQRPEIVLAAVSQPVGLAVGEVEHAVVEARPLGAGHAVDVDAAALARLLGAVLALVPREEPHLQAGPAVGVRQLEKEIEAADPHVAVAGEEGEALAPET